MNNKWHILLWTFVCMLKCFSLPAQNTKLDSLLEKLKTAKHDTTKCILLYKIADLTQGKDEEKYLEQKLSIANKHYKPSDKSYLNVFYGRHIANALTNLAAVFNKRGDIERAISTNLRSIKIAEDLGDDEAVSVTLVNLGLIYYRQNEIDMALKCYHNSMKILEKINNKEALGAAAHNLALVYDNLGRYDEAMKYYNYSIKINEEAGLMVGVAYSLNNIGYMYLKKKDFKNGMEYYMKSLNLRKKLNDKMGLCYSYDNVSNALYFQKKFKESVVYGEQAFALAKELGNPEQIRNATSTLKRNYVKLGRHKEAFEMYEIYLTMRDSLNNIKTKKASIKSQMKYEYEKKAAADSVKNIEEQKVKDAQLAAQNASLKSEKTQRIALYGGLVLVVGFLIFVFNRFRITQKQKKIIEDQKIIVDEAFHKLEEKNKEVMDSIYYARRIQRALITSERYMDRKLKSLKS